MNNKWFFLVFVLFWLIGITESIGPVFSPWSAMAVQPKPPAPHAVLPQSGHQHADKATIFETSYAGQDLTWVGIFFDSTQPSVKRVYSSIHAGVKKTSQGWRYSGMRYNGDGQVCGNTPEPRHCYKNFPWDVGGFSPGSGSWIYFNHDEMVRDTLQAVPNTIGRLRVLQVDEKENEVSVTWEVVFGRFFTERNLGVYLAAKNNQGSSFSTQNSSYWHQVGSWQVGQFSSSTIFAYDFENSQLPDWGRFGRDGDIAVSTEHFYRGQSSVHVITDRTKNSWQVLEKDLGSDQQARVALYFWDDLTADGSDFLYAAVSTKPYNEWDDPSTHTIAVAVRPSVSIQNYAYRARVEDLAGNFINPDPQYTWFDTGIKRTLGWHKIVFWVTNKGAWAEMDDFEKGIFPYNLSSLPMEIFTGQNRRRLPIDWQMTSFRYVKAGANNGGSVFIDNLLVESLPPVPNDPVLLTLHGANIYLDAYEEIGMWDNLDTWTNQLLNNIQAEMGRLPSHSSHTFWFSNLFALARMHAVRYKSSFLPFDKAQAIKLLNFILANRSKWSPVQLQEFDNAFFDADLTLTAYQTWNILPKDTQVALWQAVIEETNGLVDGTFVISGNRYIGDSIGENYSWTAYPLAVNAALFSNYYNADTWLAKGKEFAIKALSDNPKEACAICPGGQIGVQSIYKAGEQSGFCVGDHQNLPLNHREEYFFDNHDYHPHPNYAFATMGPLMGTVVDYQNMGLTAPPEYLHNVLNVWRAHREFVNFQNFTFKGEKIIRVRTPQFQCSNRGPYNEEAENVFRVTGLDDWSKNAFSLARPRSLAQIFGASEAQYQGFDLIRHSNETFYWQNFDYIGQPVGTNLFFSSSDLDCIPVSDTGRCLPSTNSALRIQNRLNPPYVFDLTSFSSGSAPVRLPLVVCEENIFKKKVWQGALEWSCDTQTKKEGEASTKLTTNQLSDAEVYSPLIRVEPNQTYKVSYWVKTNQLSSFQAQTFGKILAAQYNSDTKENNAVNENRTDPGFSLGENVSGTTDWVKKSYSFRTRADTNLIRLRASLGLQGTAKGTVWYDEVKLEQAKGDINGDGQIDDSDLIALLLHFFTSNLSADLNADRVVNGIDFEKIKNLLK